MSHSRYWLDSDIFDYEETAEEEATDLGRILRLAAARRATANFVNILTSRNDINVRFSSGRDSSTNGTDIIIAADDNPDHFDSMVGLALHEASHVLLTNFAFLRYIQPLRNSIRWLRENVDTNLGSAEEIPKSFATTKQTRYMHGNTIRITEGLVHPVLRAMLQTKRDDTMHLWAASQWNQDSGAPHSESRNEEWAKAANTMFADLHNIMNILEDRRIDAYVYRTASGYRPYYRALYDRFFFTKETGNNLKYNPEWREVTVQNYINRLLLMFHPANNVDALPGLQQLYNMVDLRNIDRLHDGWTPPPNTQKSETTYEIAPTIWQVANELYVQMLKYATLSVIEREEYVKADGNILDGFSAEELGEMFGDLPNLDGEPESFNPRPTEMTPRGKPGTFNKEKARKDVQKALDALNGDVKKKKAKKGEIEQASAIEEADAKVVDLKGDGIPFGKCMVIRKLTDGVFQQEWFPFKRWSWQSNAPEYLRRSTSAGKRMGQILVHRLQVRNDPMMTKQTRLPTGGLDRRLLAQLGMDITSVFQKSRVDIHRPVMLHLTLDASGSMGGEKWEKVITVATALAYLGEKMRNVDVVISLRGGAELPLVCIMHDSRKNNFQHYLRMAHRVEPSGGTPEGLCYKATMGLITECASTHDVYFINFSDGEPSWAVKNPAAKGRGRGSWQDWFNYHGEVAVRHTRNMVKQMQEAGVKILSYFITNNGSYSYYMKNAGGSAAAFRGMYGETAEFCNVSNATDVLRTLNKLLLVRG